LEAAAEAAYPEEFCALLLGRSLPDGGWRLEDYRPAANVHPQPRRHFELDPAVHIATLRELRQNRDGKERGLCLLGHIHSHPDAKAEPSATDLSMAHDPEMLWLILSVRRGKAEHLTAWRPPNPQNPDRFAPVRLKSDKR